MSYKNILINIFLILIFNQISYEAQLSSKESPTDILADVIPLPDSNFTYELMPTYKESKNICSCIDDYCDCCMDIMGHKICESITVYEDRNYTHGLELDFELFVNGKSIDYSQVPINDLPPFCHYVFEFAACVKIDTKLGNVTETKNKVCGQFQVRFIDFLITHFQLFCVEVKRLVKPEEKHKKKPKKKLEKKPNEEKNDYNSESVQDNNRS